MSFFESLPGIKAIYGYTGVSAAEAAKESAKTQAAASVQATKLSIASSEKMSEEGLLFSAGQSQTGLLIDLLSAKQKEQPVYTLGPTAQPMSWLDNINWTIHSFLIKLFGE